MNKHLLVYIFFAYPVFFSIEQYKKQKPVSTLKYNVPIYKYLHYCILDIKINCNKTTSTCSINLKYALVINEIMICIHFT